MPVTCSSSASTSPPPGPRRLLDRREGRGRRPRPPRPSTLQTPKPLWSEQDPHEWWAGTAKSIRAGPRGGQGHGRRRGGGGPHRPDARPRAAGRAAPGAAPGHPLERPAHRRPSATRSATRMGGREAPGRRPPATTPSPASPRRRSSGCASTSPTVYAQARASSCCPRTTCACASPACAAMDKADGSGTLLFDLPRATGRRTSWTGSRFPRAWLPPTFEGPEVTGDDHGRGGGGHGPARGNAGDGGRGRPGGGGGGRGCGRARAWWR